MKKIRNLRKLKTSATISDFASIYTAERDAEEALIQKGCSCEIPDDFPEHLSATSKFSFNGDNKGTP